MHEPLGFLAPDEHNTWPTCRAAVDCTFQGEASSWRCKLSPRHASLEGGGSAKHLGCIQEEECSRFLITSVACCAVMTIRQLLLDMLSTTHERNPTFPFSSFPWIRHAAPSCSALKDFSLCLSLRRMSFRTFYKRTSTWAFSCTTAAIRLPNMSR